MDATHPDHHAIALRPVQPGERVALLDVLRGFALFGVLLVNMEYFVAPSFAYMLALDGWQQPLDRVTTWAVRFAAEGKFYSLFSFLFGYGAGIQMRRADARGVRFGALYARRLFVLVLIGLLHGVLFWAGDILVPYGLVGFGLLALCRRSDRTLLITAGVGLVLATVVVAALWGVVGLAAQDPQWSMELERTFAETPGEKDALSQQALDIYEDGSVADVVARRVLDLGRAWFDIAFMLPSILAMFSIGFWASRRRLLETPMTSCHRAKRFFWALALVGVLFNAAHTLLAGMVDPVRPTLLLVAYTAFFFVGAPALMGCYLIGVAWLYRRSGLRRWLGWLAPVGRTALSNYLMQSLICTTLACGYGFGLFGKVHPLVAVAMTVVIYGLQVIISRWWLARFRFGPAEWIWRWATYGRRPAMRAGDASVVPSGHER